MNFFEIFVQVFFNFDLNYINCLKQDIPIPSFSAFFDDKLILKRLVFGTNPDKQRL